MDRQQETYNSVSPFAPKQQQGFQFGMGSLLVLMVVVSAISALLLWASRVPMVTNEIHVWLGTTPAVNQDGTDRGTQLVFLLFCYSSPLLIVAFLRNSTLILNFIERRFVEWQSSAATKEAEDAEDVF